MKKLSKFGKSTLSLLLCLTMLLTTFCFFDIGSVISNAMVTVTENNKMKGSLSSQFMYAPEIAYLKPGSSAFQYFSNYDPATGKAISTNDATSRLEFDYKGATEIAIGVNRVYYKNGENDVDFSGTLKINNVTVTQNKVAYNATTSTSFSSIASSASGTISVTLNASQCSLTGAATGTTYYIQWVFRYKVDGAYHFAFMYTGVYVPLLDQAGTSTSQRYIKSGSNPTENHSWSFITGAMKYSGGNRKSQFLGTTANTLMAAPLVSFVGRAQNENNYTIPCGDGQALNENNFSSSQTPYNTFVYNRGSRGENELFYDTTSISVPSDYSGTVTGNVSITKPDKDVTGITLGMAYIVVDTSRYTNYNQIPYLSAGYAQFYHDLDGNGNKLNSIKSVKRYNKGSSTSIAYDGTIYCDVDTSNYTDNDSYSVARGLYKFNGSIMPGLVTFDTWFFNGYKHVVGYTESIGVHHYNGLFTETVNKQTLRTVYNDASHSHIDYKTYSSGYSAYYTELKSVAETLCNPQLYSKTTTSLSGTASGSVKAIETSIVNSTTTADNYVYFYVPEVIYLTPGKTTFQYYSDMSSVSLSNGVCTPTVNSANNDSTGNIYFYYKNASKVKITQSGASSVSLSGGNVTSFNSYVNTSQSAVTTANISGGSVSEAKSDYITWTATYVEDNIEKTVTAKSYVYYPSTQSVAGSAQTISKNNPWVGSSRKRYVSVSSVIWGIHDIEITPSGGSTPNIYIGSTKYVSTENDNSETGTGGYYPSTLPIQSPNYTPSSWSGASTPGFVSSSYSGMRWVYRTHEKDTTSVGGIGKLYVDTSRFSSFSQIPNLTLRSDFHGLTSTDNIDSTEYYCNYYTISGNYNSSNTIKMDSNQYGKGTTKTTKPWKTTADLSSAETSGVDFLALKTHQYINGDDKVSADGYASVKIYRQDKSGLRKAVEYAAKYSYALQAEYFNGSTQWTNYTTALANAQDALTKVDGTADFGTYNVDSTKRSGLAKTLMDAVDVLLNANRGTAPRNTSNYTATQKNVGLVANSNGTFTVAAIAEAASDGTASISKTFKAYDKVEFSAEQYEGYKYVGYIKDGASSNGYAFSATDYNNMVNSTDPVSKSKNETLTFGNAKNVNYSYTFYYIVNPDVLFDNEFDFDSWASGILSAKKGTDGGTAAFDFATNSYTITSNGTQVQPKFLGDQGGLSYLGHRVDTKTSLIPGHKYRISYSVIGTADTTAHVAVFMFSTTSATDYSVTGEIGASTSIKANVKTSYSAEFTVKEGYTYPTFRFGIYGGSSNVPSGVSLTYSDIYLQDITTPGGFKDDVTDATPHAVLGLIPGSQIGTMSSISRTGYAFDGWYNNQDSTGNGTGTKYTSTSTVGNSNLRLYAKWTVAPELMFDNEFVFDEWSDKASFGSGDFKVDKGSNLVYLYNTTTSLDTSTGPYNGTSAYKIAVTPGHTYRIRMNVTMGATAGSVDFMAFAFNNDGVSTPAAGNSAAYRRRPTISLAANQTGTLQTKPASETNNSDEQDFVMPADAKYLTIRFGIRSANTSATFSDIYIQDITSPAGKADDVSTADPINKVKLPGETVGSLADIERSGYTFTGWNTAKNGSGTTYTESTKMPSSNTQLWSQWDVNRYTITFAPNGGSVTPTSKTFTINDSISLPTPTRTGYTFSGWKVTEKADVSNWTLNDVYTGTSIPSGKYGNVTLTAQWTVNTYTITYKYNNGAADTTAKYTIEQAITLPSPSKTGYTFAGWKVTTAGGNWNTTDSVYKGTVAAGKYGNVTLTAQWTANTYTITYVYNNGSANTTARYNIEQSITLPSPTKTGYTFAGWKVTTAGGNWNTTDSVYKGTVAAGKYGNVTLTAQWTANTITLKYNGNGNTGGTIPADSTFSYGSSVTTAAALTRAYTITYNANSGTVSPSSATATYTFGGWKSSANSKNYNAATSYTDSFGATSGSVTLTAQWSGGTVTLPTPTRTGYTFVGWYDAASGGTKIGDAGASYTATANKTLYAHWTANTITLKYNGNGNTGGTIPADSTFTYGSSVTTAAAPTRAYTITYNANSGTVSPASATATYTFGGWKSSANSKNYNAATAYTDSFGATSGSVTLTAQWSGGTVTLPTPTRTGYTFVGWYDAASGGNKIGDAGASYTATANKTLYAHWTANTITLKYNGNGNTGGTIPADSTFSYGSSVTTAAAPTKAYTVTYNANSGTVSPTSATATYTFGGWKSSANSKNYNAATAYTDSFGATSGTVTLTAQWSGGSVTLPTPTRTGYTFVGWYDAASGGTKIGDAGASYTATANKTLYAHWTANTITLKYNGNGNTGGTIPADSTFTYGSSVTTAAAPTRAYTVTYNANSGTVSPASATATYTFGGWKSSANSKNYNAATAYTDSFGATSGSVTLTAQWSGGSVTLPTPTRTGYTFVGWYDAASGGTKIGDAGASYTATANKTLYAHWTPNTITLKYNGNGNTGGTIPADSTFAYGASVTTAAAPTRAYTITYNANSGTVSPVSATATYTFGGWKSSANSKNYNATTAYTDSFGATSGSVTLTAQWSGGKVTLPTPTRTGYTFAGWYDAASGGTKIGDAGKIYTATANKTLYAHWTPNTITLKYNGNGNTGGTIPADSTFSYGASVTTAAAPTRAYTITYNANSGTVSPASATATYTFGGWKSSANSKNYNAATAYTDSFGATSGSVTLTAQWSGGTVTLPTPTRTGYTFVGWYDAASGGTKIGDAGASYTATANKTLYAHWTPNTITLKYNGNGNTGGTIPADSTFSYGASVTTAAAPTRAYTITYNANSGTVSPASATATYTFGGWKSSANSKNYNAATAYTDSFGATSGSVTLTAQWSGGKVTLPTPTRTGYTFVGWYDAATGGTKIGDAGASYTATANKTLYAHWEVNTYTVTYDYATNRGTSATKTSATVEYGAAVDLTPTATKAGWTFVGWNTNKDATTAITSLTMPANDITLYAIYKKTITAKFYWINASDGKTVTETQTVIIINAATSGTVTCSTTPASVTYNGRTFTWIGWRTDTTAAAQTKTKSTSQSVSGDTSFYAVYSGTLTLSYNANKGTGAPSSQTATQYLNSTGTTGSVSYKKSSCTFTVSTTVPTYTGWAFDGWSTTSTSTTGKYGASPKTTEISVNANTTLYAIWNKTFTVKFYYYNNQVESKSLTIYNGSSSATVASPDIADQTVGGITYTGRGWSTSNSATASVSVASGANVSVSGNANYYASYEVTRTATFYYCTEPTSTIKGSGAAQASVTADAVRYMNYTGSVTDSNYTVPTAVTSSHGNGVAEDYIGVSAAKNNSSTVTPTTANITFYAVYSESLTFYYYNGSAHTSSTLSRYMLSNGTNYNASMSGTVPTPSNIDSKTVWSGNWSYVNDSYGTGYFRTPTATGVNSLYAVYNKPVALIYNLNGATSSAIANTTGTAHLISKNGGVNTFAVSLAITDTVPTKTNYTFLGWADTASATAPQYYAKHSFSLSADKTIYAVWLETATPDGKVDNKDTYSQEIDVVKGVKVTGFTDDDVTVQEITTKHKLYNASENAAYQALCDAYTSALNTYKNSPSVDNAKALTTARNNLANAVAPKYNSSDRTYIDGKFTIEYASGVTNRPVTAGEHSVSELNLNHYVTENLDSTLYQLETTTKISLANEQSKINTAVKTIAKNFVNKALAKDTDPMYSVYENAKKAVDAGLAASGIKAINYVYTGKGNYTYYCYTNTATPTLILTIDDVVGNGRVCYPTKSKVEKTATVSGTVNSSAYSIGTTSVDNNEYQAYLAMGMGTSMTGGAAYYSQKSVVKLTPTFTSGKNGSVCYQIKASDDSYNSVSTEFGGNYATTSKLSSGKTTGAISTSTSDTNVTPVNTITIVIDYHETTNETGHSNSMYIYGDQVINDKWLKQFHILRSSGGASNWEWPKTTDAIYTVNDGTYGQSNYGSFTYTFTYTSGASNNFAAASLGTIDAATIAGLLKSTTNYNSMKSKTFAGANKGGDGLGYMEWPASGGWNINYYPKNQAYTYVHIVDRWGNVDDKVIYVGNIDAIAAQFKTASVGDYTVLEDGGSGIDMLSLNSSGFEILTDDNSTLENNVFRTSGNTVRISTGEANKAYTLTMTDKATNASTATVKSDENGIITLSVEDSAYESGVYTFMLNSIEVNLYDGADTDKHVLSVTGDEVDEGEAAQITVTTKGDVSKLRFIDESGNTSTVSSFVQNDDGTRTWTFAKARPAGEYTYRITVKVGYEWFDEGDTAALIFNERILDSGKVRSAEYDEETGLYKVTFEGRATKVQFVSEDGMTRTYTRYADTVKSIKTYDADGNEVNDTARTLDHEVWYVEAKLYSGQNYTVVGKFEAGWNRAEDSTSTVTAK